MKHFNRFIYTIIYTLSLVGMINCEEDENYFELPVTSEELIDPHSFYYDKQNKKMCAEPGRQIFQDPVNVNDKTQALSQSFKQKDNHSNHEAVFYKRLINLLLSNINIKMKDEMSVIGVLEIEMSHSQMEILQNFHTYKTSLREIDEILSDIIKKPSPNYMAEMMNVFDVILQKCGMALIIIQQHPDAAIIVIATIMIALTWRLIRWRQGFPMFIFIQVIFILSFFMTWWQLIQEAEVKFAATQMKFINMPITCQPDKMTMWDKLVSLFSSNEECEQYHQAKMSNPKLKITPAFVLSHFITTVVLHPVTHIGTVVSDFINNATDNLPWTYAWMIKLILYLCIGFVIIIIPFCLSGASINFGLGPLLRFGISYQKNHEKGNALKNVEKRDPVQIILQVPVHGTDVPRIKDASDTEQSKTVQIITNNYTEKYSDKEHDCIEHCEDLSCGDTIRNELLGSDTKETETCKKLGEKKRKENDGSGDN